MSCTSAQQLPRFDSTCDNVEVSLNFGLRHLRFRAEVVCCSFLVEIDVLQMYLADREFFSRELRPEIIDPLGYELGSIGNSELLEFISLSK